MVIITSIIKDFGNTVTGNLGPGVQSHSENVNTEQSAKLLVLYMHFSRLQMQSVLKCINIWADTKEKGMMKIKINFFLNPFMEM